MGILHALITYNIKIYLRFWIIDEVSKPLIYSLKKMFMNSL